MIIVPVEAKDQASLVGRSVRRVDIPSEREPLPVTEDDIRITRGDGVFRVDVEYKIPINLIVYTGELEFHSISAGLPRE